MRKGITVWDPFCGTGIIESNIYQLILNYFAEIIYLIYKLRNTIILSMLIRKFNKSIRRSMFLPLYQIPIFKHTYVENEQNELDINILANDINEQQLRIFYKILDCFNNLKRILRQQSPKLRILLNWISQACIKNSLKVNYKKDDLIVITNPPWGRTVNLDKFTKMTKFLETNMQLMLFVDCKKWQLLAELLVGGQWTKIIKYDRNRETQLNSSEIITQQSNQIITQSTTTERYSLIQEDLEKVQKVLDEKAKKKSLKLLNQEKKRSQILPRW